MVAFYSLFLLVCLWQYVDLKQDFQLSPQATFKDCLQKYCTDQPVIQTSSKISSWKSCYKKCLMKIRKQSFVGTRHTNPFSKRIRRVDSSTKENLTQAVYSKDQEECKNAAHNGTSLSKKDIDITFHNQSNMGWLYANVSWNPPPDKAVNWTGYRMIYVIGDNDSPKNCRDLGKNATFSIVNIPSNVLSEFEEPIIWVMITFLPYLRSESGKSWKGRFIPNAVTRVELSTKTRMDATMSPSTDDKEIHSGTSPSSEMDFTTSPSTDKAMHGEITPSSGNENGYNNIVLPISIVLVVLVLTGVAVFVFKCALRSKSPPQSRTEYNPEYDAFIIYSSGDDLFVTQTLLPTLEKHAFKYCIHYRDFLAGIPFRDNMVDFIYKSRKTIAVISRNFFKSKYCPSELDIALHRLLERRDESVVVIKLDNVERSKLPRALRDRSYIDYSKSTDRETWEKKLVKSLRVKNNAPQDDFAQLITE